jgi:hypothetical protein
VHARDCVGRVRGVCVCGGGGACVVGLVWSRWLRGGVSVCRLELVATPDTHTHKRTHTHAPARTCGGVVAGVDHDAGLLCHRKS